MNVEEVRSAYDHVAEEYHRRLAGELQQKPFDQAWLHALADSVTDGQVLEVGYGDGHVCAHLASMGLDVRGCDLSPGMIAVARRAYPDIGFEIAERGHRPPYGEDVEAQTERAYLIARRQPETRSVST